MTKTAPNFTTDQILLARQVFMTPEAAEDFARRLNTADGFEHNSGDFSFAFGWFLPYVEGSELRVVASPRALVRAEGQDFAFDLGFTFADDFPEIRQPGWASARPLSQDDAEVDEALAWLNGHTDYADELIVVANLLRRFANPNESPMSMPVIGLVQSSR